MLKNKAMTIRWGTGDSANWVLSVRWQREKIQLPEEGILLSPLSASRSQWQLLRYWGH